MKYIFLFRSTQDQRSSVTITFNYQKGELSLDSFASAASHSTMAPLRPTDADARNASSDTPEKDLPSAGTRESGSLTVIAVLRAKRRALFAQVVLGPWSRTAAPSRAPRSV
ncbi:hypothetical protein AnigIFM56816_002222 [Aspergillus niger]|nr:hypothetical protein AnigIFM56816_002222 [Aspergillus niger]